MDRSDDTAAVLKYVASVSGTEDAVTKQWQAVTISDSTDPVANKLAVNVGGAASVIAASNSGVDIGDVTINNVTAIPVDGSGVTQPVSAASLPLPTGAATAAKQDTGNTSLSSIDGKITAVNTGAVVVSSSALPTGASTAAKQPALGTAGTASADVISVQGIASMTPLLVNGSGVTQPVSGTVTANLSATDNAVLDAIEADTTTIAGAVAGTEMQVDVLTMPVVAVSQSGTWDEVGIHDSGNSITIDGNVGVVPVTTGGCSMYHKVSAGNDNAANIKASAGQVYGITIYNNAAYPVYVKLHNTAGTPTAGAGVVRAFGCQAGTQSNYPQPAGMTFATGIGITIVKDLADAGTTAVVASDCVVGIEWK